MRTIYRYKLGLDDFSSINLPVGAEVLSISNERVNTHIEIEMWAAVDTNRPLVTRQFAVVGTGHAMPEGSAKFIGTVMVDNGEYVFHVFEVGNL